MKKINNKTKDIPIRQRSGKEFVGLEKTGATGFSKTISMFMEVNQNGKY